MTWISVLVLAVAVSLDSIAAGITYGMNQITIPFASKVVISIVSGCSVLVSMSLGGFLQQRIDSSVATMVGGLLFVLLGLHHLWISYRSAHSRVLINWRIPFLRIIIRVYQEPLLADEDHSQTITGQEAFVLGGALALDAVATGFAAAMMGLPIWPATLAVTLASYLFISQGLRIGIAFGDSLSHRRVLSWLPGIMVLGMGLLKILFR